MAISFDYPPGATPLDPDEAAGLIPRHIANHGQLNEWEFLNIVKGEQWAFGRRHADWCSSAFIRKLHGRMFGETWRWAGSFRTTEKNIGIDPARIAPALHDLCADVAVQLEHAAMPVDESRRASVTVWYRFIRLPTAMDGCHGRWRISCSCIKTRPDFPGVPLI